MTRTLCALPLLAALALLPASAGAQTETRAQAPQLFSGTYQTKYGFLTATGERGLKALPDGRWEMENSARLLMVKVEENSTFTLENGRVHSLTYQFVNPLSKGRSMSVVFDWPNNTAIDAEHHDTVQLQPGVSDKLSYQLQLQMDVCANPEHFPGENFTVVDHGRLKTYRVELVGRESLKTKVGVLDAIHLRQFRPDKRDGKDTMIWLAADWHCLLVRLDQHEGDDIISLTLVKAKVGGATVVGKP